MPEVATDRARSEAAGKALFRPGTWRQIDSIPAPAPRPLPGYCRCSRPIFFACAAPNSLRMLETPDRPLSPLLALHPAGQAEPGGPTPVFTHSGERVFAKKSNPGRRAESDEGCGCRWI